MAVAAAMAGLAAFPGELAGALQYIRLVALETLVGVAAAARVMKMATVMVSKLTLGAIAPPSWEVAGGKGEATKEAKEPKEAPMTAMIMPATTSSRPQGPNLD